jgi:hypothetical protein
MLLAEVESHGCPMEFLESAGSSGPVFVGIYSSVNESVYSTL